jgi:RHS repeat-associated protein
MLRKARVEFPGTVFHLICRDSKAYPFSFRLQTEDEWTNLFNDGLKVHRIVTYGYDADGNRQSVQYPSNIARSSPDYDVDASADYGSAVDRNAPISPPRPPAQTPSNTASFAYDYTQRNQLWHIYPAGTVPWVTYAYDLNGNMTKRQTVKDGVNDSTNIMDANGVSQYDALNRPTMWEQTGNAIVNEVLVHDSSFARSHFAYDKLSRLTGSWRDEQGGKGEWYGYHVTGSLTGVAYNADGVSTGTPQNATRTVDYYLTPDTLNRSVMNDSGEPSSYTPNALNQYTDMNGGALYYDGNFNLMWTGGFSAGYDADKRLTAIGSGEDYGQFVYDGLGRCLKRTIDWETTLIAYDGWKPIVEWDEWNNEKAWNIYGSGPDEILYRHDFARGDLRYHLDRMGNVAFLLDGDGDGIERYTYDAFGSPIVTDWDGNNARPYSWYGNRFMFTGREYFPEFGLYDFRNRMYHPVLGRFLQSDPIGFGGGDANLFRYCGGDPVNGSDPSGMLEKKAPGLKTPPPIRPYEPVNFGSNGYTPTGSLIPQQLYGIPNGSGFDLFAHDYINGTQSLGTFLLIGSAGTQSNGGGNSGGGGAQFISVALLFQSARSSEVDPNQSSTTEAFGDDELFAALDKAVLQAQNLPPGKDMVDFFKAMANFDTGFYHNVCYNYTGHVENMGGYWSGYEVNYIGVGAGFAAGGFSLGAMDNWILGYNYYQGYTNPMVQGKMAWAKVAFDYYSAGH